jgi:phage terminase Nu1 subunit (DNA packaging protein)
MTAKTQPNVLDMTVDADGLALIFGVTRQSVYSWAKERGLPKVAPGRYPLAACVQWRLAKIIELSRGDSTLETERKRLIQTQRHRIEIENANMQSELLPADEVGMLLDALQTIFDAALDALPASIAEQVAAADEPGVVQTVIDAATTATRQAAAAAVQDYAHSYNGEAPAAKPRKRRKLNGGAKAA